MYLSQPEPFVCNQLIILNCVIYSLSMYSLISVIRNTKRQFSGSILNEDYMNYKTTVKFRMVKHDSVLVRYKVYSASL